MFKVSTSAVSRSTDVCRSRFDAAALAPGSNDPIGTYGVDYGWLCCAGAFEVSGLVILCWIVIDTLDLNPTTSPSPSQESNDSV